MKFSDYFSKNFETSDDNQIESLRTRYYRAKIEEAKKAIDELITEEKGTVVDENEKFLEILFETSAYTCTVTFVCTTPVEVAIDFRITTFDFFSFGKGKKIIERFYSTLDKKLQLKGVGLYK